MSIADAVRTRALEARVAALEQRVEESTNAELDNRLKMLQGQLNSLRAKVDRLIPSGPPLPGGAGPFMKTDDAA